MSYDSEYTVDRNATQSLFSQKVPVQESGIDLHMHTTASDGVDSPEEVVKMAASKGYAAIAITDHDTISGIKAALTEAEVDKIEVVPGVEFSINFRPVMHMLGFYIDVNNEKLHQYFRGIDKMRMCLITKSFKMLKYFEIKVNPIQLLKEKKAITIVNLKNYLLEHEILQDNVELNNFFEDVLDEWRNCLPSPKECIDLIHDCNGVAFLAHPKLLSRDDSQLKELVTQLKKDGMDGIEIIHPKHPDNDRIKYMEWANELGLMYSGGSDYHGKGEQILQPNSFIPYSCLKVIQQRLKEK